MVNGMGMGVDEEGRRRVASEVMRSHRRICYDAERRDAVSAADCQRCEVSVWSGGHRGIGQSDIVTASAEPCCCQ